MRFVFLYALSKAIFLSDISGETRANIRNDLSEKSQLNLSKYQIWRKCARQISSCFMRIDRSLERTQAPRGVPNALKTRQRSNYGQRVTSADSRCGITTLSRIWGTTTAHKWVSPPVICDKIRTCIHERYGPTTQNFFEIRVVRVGQVNPPLVLHFVPQNYTASRHHKLSP
jgi:hypothetical protein